MRRRLRRDAGALGTDHEDGRAPQGGPVERLAVVGHEADDVGARQAGHEVGERQVLVEREREHGAHARTYRLGPVEVGGAGRRHEGGGAEGHRRAQQRADVAGIADGVGVHHEQVLAGAGRRREPAPPGQREHGHHIGRRVQGADLVRHVLGHRIDGRRRPGRLGAGLNAAGPAGEPQPQDKLFGALRAHEDHLRPVAGGEAGHDEVGALHEEGAFPVTELALAQRRRPLHEGVLRAAERLS